MKETSKNFEHYKKVKPLAVFDFSRHEEDTTFTQEDLEKAESVGYSKGFTEGLELGTSQGELKASSEIDVITRGALEKIGLYLHDIRESEKLFVENFFPNIVKVCHAVLQKTMPYFFKKHGKEEMTKILHDVVKTLTIKVPIQIKVSNQLYENLSTDTQTLFNSYPETINIIKVSDFSDETCEIDWEGGSAKWNLNERYQEIDSKLQEYLNTNENQGEHHG